MIHRPEWRASTIVDELLRRGHQVEYCCPAVGEELPAVGRHHAVAVAGGFVGVDRARDHEWMRDELAFVTAIHEAGVPYLGLCLGAQLLAATAGLPSRRRPDGDAELGFHPIAVTAAGAALFGDLDRVYQAHDEGIDRLPAGAELLASSERFPIQAYRWGASIGVQFHPDAHTHAIEQWWHGNTHLHGRRGSQPLAEQLRWAVELADRRAGFVERLVTQWLAAVRPGREAALRS